MQVLVGLWWSILTSWTVKISIDISRNSSHLQECQFVTLIPRNLQNFQKVGIPLVLRCIPEICIHYWHLCCRAKAHHHTSQQMILMIAMKYPYYTKLWPLCLILMKYHVDEGMESHVCQLNDKERDHGNVVRIPNVLCLVLVLMVY